MAKEVLVLGGGVSGIVVADTLTHLGASVTILEKEESLGGMLRYLRRQIPGDDCRFCTTAETATACLRANAKRLQGVRSILAGRLSSVRRQQGKFSVVMEHRGGVQESDFDAVVVATGAEELRSEEELKPFLYGEEKDVVTALGLEKMLLDAADKGEKIVRSDRTPIRSVAFICCVGSRSAERVFCSSTCCSFGLRQFNALKRLVPDITGKFFFIDLRVPDKPMWRYALATFSDGLQPIRCRITRIERDEGGLFLRYEDHNGDIRKEHFDLFVLLAAQVPNRETERLLSPLGVRFNEDGFILTRDFSTATDAEGVFACGSATGPKSIADSIVGAKATAAEVAAYLGLRAEGEVVVVGGGLAASTAAYTLAELGLSVKLLKTADEEDGEEKRLLRSLNRKIEKQRSVEVLDGASVGTVRRHAGGYHITVLSEGGDTFISASAIVLALAGMKFNPLSRRKKSRRLLELSRLIKRVSRSKGSIRRVAVVLCEGAFTEEHPYCGRDCCYRALKVINGLKEKFPEVEIFVLAKEVNSFGLNERLYRKAREAGVLFLRYPYNIPVDVKADKKGVVLRYYDTVLYQIRSLRVDVVAFASFTIPSDYSGMVEKFGVELDEFGFVRQKDAKFRPTETKDGRLLVCGDCLHPQELERKILEAKAASVSAALVATKTDKKPLSFVLERRCILCKLCVKECPFGARMEENRRIVVDALCVGCGLCVSVCPSGAAHLTEEAEALTVMEPAL